MATEKRLIDANELLRDAEDYGPIKGGLADMYDVKWLVDAQITVDAVEVVRGRWEDFCRNKMCCCSVCKAEFDNTCNEIHGEWYFCPNCGAKMDLE